METVIANIGFINTKVGASQQHKVAPRQSNTLYRVFFFDWSAPKMTKYEEKLKYLNWSANCSSGKVLSVNPQ